MIYPDNFEIKIGFNKIRDQLSSLCLCDLGKRNVELIEFSNSMDVLAIELAKVEEFKIICQLEDNFPLNYYVDIHASLAKIHIENAYIETFEAFNFMRSYQTISHLIKFFSTKRDSYPNLAIAADEVVFIKPIYDRLCQLMNDKGEIKDNASPELFELRSKHREYSNQVSRRMNAILRNLKNSGIVEDDANLTIRDGRLVIPVDSANKRSISCFVHDESSTGKTSYIEPTECFETNNKLREIEYAEKREIIRILIDFTDFIRPHLEELLLSYDFLGQVDFIRAKALFAIKIKAIKPILVDRPLLDWNEAIHPLLYLLHQKNGIPIIPLQIKLDEIHRILVVSGPNAGGKSVSLKTVGLLQYMLQCGLLIPVNDNAKSGIFNNLFIDIGDEQSLENDLSTYSSHLVNMRFFVENTNNKTLFLIDEFGTGTEPLLGGAIAESILEKLNELKAFGVVNTHYTNLKHLAENQEGLLNAAMLFDSVNMKPLYRLVAGKPGSSFAFEIASLIGMPKDVMNRAMIKAGKKNIDFDRNLQKIEKDTVNVEQKIQDLGKAEELLNELIDRNKNELIFAEEYRKSIIKQAQEEARNIIAGSNREIENTIRIIKENNADKLATINARQNLDELKNNLTTKIDTIKIDHKSINNLKPLLTNPPKQKNKKKHLPVQKPPIPSEEGEIKINHFVRIKGQEAVGQVDKISNKKAEISFGSVKVTVPLAKLEKVKQKEYLKSLEPRTNRINVNWDYTEKIKELKTTIDLRGKRAEDAMTIFNQYIEDAVLLDIQEVKILHGKGDGILRQLVRETLQHHQKVKEYHDEKVEFGGTGITIVEFHR